MSYVGSHAWKIRQKVGHDLLILPSVDMIAVRADGALLMIYSKQRKRWCFPGGYIEEGQTSEETAVRELLEETGLATKISDLVPFAGQSGYRNHYSSGDVTQPFTQTYLIRNWRDVGGKLDKAEVEEIKWFMPDELLASNLDSRMKKIFLAYNKFLDTGEYQIINLKGEKYDYNNQDV